MGVTVPRSPVVTVANATITLKQMSSGFQPGRNVVISFLAASS